MKVLCIQRVEAMVSETGGALLSKMYTYVFHSTNNVPGVIAPRADLTVESRDGKLYEVGEYYDIEVKHVPV